MSPPLATLHPSWNVLIRIVSIVLPFSSLVFSSALIGHCNGLNVFVPPPPRHSYVEILTPNVLVLGGRASGGD